MNTLLNNHLKLHFIVVLFGFTAILGKLITLPATQLVWYRMLIAFLTLGLVIYLRKIPVNIGIRNILKIMLVGIIVALHWITFFHAVKISNVSVTLGCLASGPLFISFLEPLIIRRKIYWIEIVIGFVIIFGLYLIFQFELHYIKGIITALISTFSAALFTVINKTLTNKYNPVTISFYEMISGFIGISIFLFVTKELPDNMLKPNAMDIVYILILGIICTAYAFVVAVDVMRVLSAYTVALTINLEPVYGILLAWLFFGQSEFMTYGFYIGTVIILVAVFLHPVLVRMQDRR